MAWLLFAWGAAELLVVNSDLPRADAIVVLAGAKAYVERAERAAQLFHEGHAPIILLTNDGLRGPWSSKRQDNPRLVERAAEELARLGVGADRIKIVPGVVSGGTYGEARRIRQYASAHRLESILIVTSAYHSRRALWSWRQVFDRSGIEVDISVAKRGVLSSIFWWLFPSGWRTVGEEYAKFLYYLVRYSSLDPAAAARYTSPGIAAPSSGGSLDVSGEEPEGPSNVLGRDAISRCHRGIFR